MASNARSDALRTPSDPPVSTQAPPRPPRRRSARFARGPLVIGDPSPALEPKLAAPEPYRADTVIDGGSAFGLTVRAASVRGLSKRWTGGPRQDDICLGCHDPSRTLVAAVADGVSAAARSQLGAALAVRQAVATVVRQLDQGPQIDWREVFDHAAWALLEEQRSSSGDARAGIDDAAAMLATTLLVAVVGAADRSFAQDGDGSPPASPGQRDGIDGSHVRVQLAGVGDSPALMLKARRFHPLLGGPGGDGLLGEAVHSLPRASDSVCSACCELRAGEVLLLCTDGLALPLAGGGGEVGDVFARALVRPPDIVDFGRLLDFSRSTYDDDRSLIAIWPHSRP